jgi:hypothetical protein
MRLSTVIEQLSPRIEQAVTGDKYETEMNSRGVLYLFEKAGQNTIEM